MKRLLAIGALLACGSAWAGDGNVRIKTLAAETGLTVSEIQMLSGARTPHMECMTSYARAQQRLVQALGEERARALLSGREVRIDDGARLALR